MGQLFELIADNALETLDEYYTDCNVCGKSEIDLYEYNGKYRLDNGEIDDDIFAVCAECILTKNLSHVCDFEYIKTIKEYLSNTDLTIQEQSELENKLIEKYQRTPDIPLFVQGDDTPLCCNDITEFTGSLKQKKDFDETEKYIYWERKIISEKYEFFDFIKYGNVESLSEISTFKCSHCGMKYFTFQFT